MAGLVSEHPTAVHVLTGPKHYKSVQEGTFILLVHHSDVDRAGKRPC